MFKRILIANRGEPALRVVRTCRELGIESVVVYSEIDSNTLPVKLADHAVCIGPTPVADSYLNVPRVLGAAEITASEAIHPAYGFLAEHAEFAEAVESCKLAFVGPSSELLRRLNDRLANRSLARELGIPVLPGSEKEVGTAAEAKGVAEGIGYPIVLKPAVKSRKHWTVRKDKDLEMTLRLAQAEAKGLFNDSRVYLERYLENARHIEVQVLGDATGKQFVLLDRESSVQHRQEKIMDEAPSPLLNESVRRQVVTWSEQFAAAVGYRGAGTIEYLADASGNLFFLEMRAVLQAAHPVTEVLLGCDLVAEQLRIAAGQPVSEEVRSGANPTLPPQAPHVIQCRIGAEDAEHDFMPTAGVLKNLRFPGGPGVRVDSHCYPGYQGSAEYDTLVAKIIVWDADRNKAIARMERALQETAIEGVKTTLEFQQKILKLGAFRKGALSTTMVEREILGVH